jgi:hypothetical protein
MTYYKELNKAKFEVDRLVKGMEDKGYLLDELLYDVTNRFAIPKRPIKIYIDESVEFGKFSNDLNIIKWRNK